MAERHLSGGPAGGGPRRTLVGSGRGSSRGYEPIFQDDGDEDETSDERQRREGTRKPLDVGGDRGRAGLSEADEEAWDRLG